MPDAEIDALAEALWSQTPHGDTGDLSDLPDALQAEFRKRATNIRRRLFAAGIALTRSDGATRGRGPDCLPFCLGGWHEVDCPEVATSDTPPGE